MCRLPGSADRKASGTSASEIAARRTRAPPRCRVLWPWLGVTLLGDSTSCRFASSGGSNWRVPWTTSPRRSCAASAERRRDRVASGHARGESARFGAALANGDVAVGEHLPGQRSTIGLTVPVMLVVSNFMMAIPLSWGGARQHGAFAVESWPQHSHLASGRTNVL